MHHFLLNRRKGRREVQKYRGCRIFSNRIYRHGFIDIHQVSEHRSPSNKAPLSGRDPSCNEGFDEQPNCACQQPIVGVCDVERSYCICVVENGAIFRCTTDFFRKEEQQTRVEVWVVLGHPLWTIR